MRDGRRVPLRDQPVLSVAGLATLRQMPPTAAGVMFIMLEDETGFIQCIVLPEMQEKNRAVFRSAALIVKGRLQGHGAWRGLVVQDAWPLENTIGGYEGYASSQGGTDRRIISVDGSKAGASEYARDLMREVEELRKEIAGKTRVDAERR
jgi:error-prone DNA polymerase